MLNSIYNYEKLSPASLPRAPESADSERLCKLLANGWEVECLSAAKAGKEPKFHMVLLRIYGIRLFGIGLLAVFKDCILKTSQALLLSFILQALIHGRALEIFSLVAGLVAATGLISVLQQVYIFLINYLALQLKIGCSALVFAKTIRLSHKALKESSGAGQISNFLANDVTKFDVCLPNLNYLWVGPICLIALVAVLWFYVGAATFAGIFIMIAIIPFQSYMTKTFHKFYGQVSQFSDKRIQLMSEVVNSILLIKMKTLEGSYGASINSKRNEEQRVIQKMGDICAGFFCFVSLVPRTAILFTLGIYALSGNVLDPVIAFLTMTLYSNIGDMVSSQIPFAAVGVSDLRVVCARVEEFLRLEEKPLRPVDSEVDSSKSGVVLEAVSSTWDGPPVLTGISLTLQNGKFVALMGTFGSGKSTLLRTILGEVSILSGSASVSGSVAFVSQNFWSFFGTIRDNVVFHSEFEEKWYWRVIEACQMAEDIWQLPDGDATQVGDKGSTLSGGQKARLSFARAVYARADVYIIDDILSSLDVHVAQQIMNQCIYGLLREKAVLLATHQTKFLEGADEIIVLEEGAIKARGSFKSLRDHGFIPKKVEGDTVDQLATKDPLNVIFDEEDEVDPTPLKRKGETYGTFVPELEEITDERVGLGFWLTYLRSGAGPPRIFFLFLLSIGVQVLITGVDIFVYVWSGEGAVSFRQTELNVGIFASLLVLALLVSCVRNIILYRFCTTPASVFLHQKMLNSILRAPMSFFGTSTAGQVLNRFTKDIGKIDNSLPHISYKTINLCMQILGTITLLAVRNYVLVIPSALLAFLIWLARRKYVKVSSDLFRQEAIQRSPVLSTLTTTLAGLETIRAFRREDKLVEIFHQRQRNYTSVSFMILVVTCISGIVIESICFVYFVIITATFLTESSDPSLVGLALCITIGVCSLLASGVSSSVKLENELVAVERVLEYSDLPSENSYQSVPGMKPSSTWPKTGRIRFSNLNISYSNNGPLVLQNINLSIYPGEKIGVVGRTGSGKTTLVSSLFRIVEPLSGSIHIDGVNIRKIGLYDLRHSITIIAQNPLLSVGTIRQNLDPLGVFSDNEITRCLEEAGLGKAADNTEISLDSMVEEGGENFSYGERQIICLASALLKRAKIIILDEATAHVDAKTDAKIQEVIRSKFSDATILTIAHRLGTIMDSDRILVLEHGRITEFDTPPALLRNPSSWLSEMTQKAGMNTSIATEK